MVHIQRDNDDCVEHPFPPQMQPSHRNKKRKPATASFLFLVIAFPLPASFIPPRSPLPPQAEACAYRPASTAAGCRGYVLPLRASARRAAIFADMAGAVL